MIERELDVSTPEGEMKTFIFHPEHDGPHPAVLFLMDAPSIRPALMDMASRLATAGYYVMMPYLFYRGGPFKIWDADDFDMHDRFDLMGALNPTNILSDAEALLAIAGDDDAADTQRIGAVGYCMSGGLAISIARARPEQVKAVASIHGAWLVREGEDSPHLGLDAVQAELHFGWADKDATAPVEHKETMEAALSDAGVTYTLDFHTDAEHGYAPAGRRHHHAASELHWERVHSLLRRNL